MAGAVDPRKLVFVDEMGTNTSLSRGTPTTLPKGEGPTQKSRVTVGRTRRYLRA